MAVDQLVAATATFSALAVVSSVGALNAFLLVLPPRTAAIRSAAPEQVIPQRLSATATVSQWWYRDIPSVARYFVSGNLGNVCFFFCERLITFLMELPVVRDELPTVVHKHHVYGAYADSVSFFAAYLTHVPAQHYLHAVLVYGLDSIATAEKYWTTLGGTYSALTASCIGSTAVNHYLLRQGLPKRLAFVTTLYVFSVFNYFVIGWIVRAATEHSLLHTTPTAAAAATPNKTDIVSWTTTAGRIHHQVRGGAAGFVSSPWRNHPTTCSRLATVVQKPPPRSLMIATATGKLAPDRMVAKQNADQNRSSSNES